MFLKMITYKIMEIKPFNPYKFYWYQKKRGMHEEAIKVVLEKIEANKPDNPWAYGNKVMGIINGNYNERDHVKKHESVKESREEFADFMETNADFRHLVRGIGDG